MKGTLMEVGTQVMVCCCELPQWNLTHAKIIAISDDYKWARVRLNYFLALVVEFPMYQLMESTTTEDTTEDDEQSC